MLRGETDGRFVVRGVIDGRILFLGVVICFGLNMPRLAVEFL